MAKSVDTQVAWNAFLDNYGKGGLAAAARNRVEKLQIEEAILYYTPELAPAPADTPAPADPANTKPADAAPRLKQAALIETVFIPGGVFMMGNDAGKSDEKPRHQVRLDGFHMGRAEITNREYLAFLEDTGHPRPRDPAFTKNYLMAYPSLPVVNVSYYDAIAFCRWASRKLGVTVRLPTEAEWEYAARGRNPDSIFPWGVDDPKYRTRYRDNAPRDLPTVPRETFPANDFGLFNMNGNVSEWVSDFYSRDYYSVSPVKNPGGPDSGTKRVIRSGNWAEDQTQLATPRRASRDPKDRSDQIGFRIVIEPNARP
jgi:formylglycine-generating enzyme required for sulfatase activity